MPASITTDFYQQSFTQRNRISLHNWTRPLLLYARIIQTGEASLKGYAVWEIDPVMALQVVQ